jgi:hypothetical protein
MTQTKKTWRLPQLIVLARAEPLESVLAGCKGSGSASPRKDPKGCAGNPPDSNCRN